MRVEIRIYKNSSRGRRWWLERKLHDAFCVVCASDKRLTRSRVKKLLRLYLKQRWIGFVSKDPTGVFHASYTGLRSNECPYHFVWYYVEVEALTEGESNVSSRDLQCAVVGDDGGRPGVSGGVDPPELG